MEHFKQAQLFLPSIKNANCFGKNQFFLPLIKNSKGLVLPNSAFSKDELYKDLQTPFKANIEYAVRAFLYRTDLEFQGINQSYKELIHKLSESTSENMIHSNSFIIKKKKYYEIDLNHLPDVVQGKIFLVDFKSTTKKIAHVIIENNQASIYASQPITIKSHPSITSLKVLSNNDIYIGDTLKLKEDLILYGETITLNSKKIRNKHTILYGATCCKLNSHIKTEMIQIKTAMLRQAGFIEATTGQFIVRKAKQSGDIFAKKGVIKVAEQWQSKCVNETFATTHSPDFVQILCCYYIHNGAISTNRLELNTIEAGLNGPIHAAKVTAIHSERFLGCSNQAVFFINGLAYLSSDFIINYSGKIFYSSKLTVDWKKIGSTKQKLEIKSHQQLQKINNIDTQKQQNSISLHANESLNMSGYIYAENAHINITSGKSLSITGLIWHDSSLLEKYSINIKAEQLEFIGCLQTNGKANFQVTEHFVHTGHIHAETTNIVSREYALKENASLLTNQLYIKAENKIYTNKKSNIEAKQAYLSAKDIILRGDTAIQKGFLEASRLVLLIGKTNIDDLTAISAIFASIGHLSASEKLVVSSYINFIAGTIISNSANISSLININPFSLTLQTALSLPSFSTLLFTAANLALGITGLILPGIQGITGPIQVALGSMVQIYSTQKMLRQTKTTFQQLAEDSSSSEVIKAVCLFSQFAMTVASSVLSGFFNLSAFKNAALPQNMNFQLPDFSSLTKTVSGALTRLLTSNSNFSLIDIGLLRFFAGVGNTETHAFSASLGSNFALTNSEINLISFKNNIDFVLGSSSETGIQLYETGNTFSLMGRSISVTNDIYMLPILARIGITENNISRILGTYKDYSIQSDLLNVEGNIVFECSNITTNQTNYKGSVLINNSRVESNFKNAGDDPDKKDELVIVSSLIKGSIDNTGTVIIANSALAIDKINNAEKACLQIILSKGSIENLATENKSVCAIDASTISTKNFKASENAQVAIRSSKINIDNLNNDTNIFIDDSDCVIGTYKEVNTIESSQTSNKAQQTKYPTFRNHGIFKIFDKKIPVTQPNNSNSSKTSSSIILTDSWLETTSKSNDFKNHKSFITDHVDSTKHDSFIADQKKFTVTFDGKINYTIDNQLNLNNETIISVVPIDYHAKNISITGDFNSNTAIEFDSDEQITTNSAHMTIGGRCVFNGKNGVTNNHTEINALGELIIKSDGLFSNDTSTLNAIEDIVIEAKDIKSFPTLSRTVTKDKHWKWHGINSGNETVTKIATKVDPGIIYSESGNVYIQATDQDINITANHIHGKKIVLEAKQGSVNVFDAEGKTIITKRLHGPFRDSKDRIEYVDYMPSALIGQENVSIFAKNKFVDHGTIIITDGKFNVEAKIVEFIRPILKTTIEHESIGFGITSGLSAFFSDDFDPAEYMPIMQSFEKISRARSDLAAVAASVNLSINTFNQVSKIVNEYCNGASLIYAAGDVLFMQNLLAKIFSIGISFGREKSEISYESLGAGSIKAKEIVITAQEEITFQNAFEIQATDSCELTAKHVEINGAALHSEMTFEKEEVSVNVNLMSPTFCMDVSASMQQSSTSSLTHVMAEIDTQKLTINTDVLDLKSAKIHAKELNGNVGTINITSEKDIHIADSMQVGGSTSGMVSYSEDHSHKETIVEKSSLTADDTSQFHAGEINITEGTTNVTASTVEKHKIKLDNSEHGFGVSLNIEDLATAIDPTKFTSTSSDVIEAIKFSITKDLGDTIELNLPYINIKNYENLKSNINYLEAKNNQEDMTIAFESPIDVYQSEEKLVNNFHSTYSDSMVDENIFVANTNLAIPSLLESTNSVIVQSNDVDATTEFIDDSSEFNKTSDIEPLSISSKNSQRQEENFTTPETDLNSSLQDSLKIEIPVENYVYPMFPSTDQTIISENSVTDQPLLPSDNKSIKPTEDKQTYSWLDSLNPISTARADDSVPDINLLDNPPLGLSEILLQSTLPLLNDYGVTNPHTPHYYFLKSSNDDFRLYVNPMSNTVGFSDLTANTYSSLVDTNNTEFAGSLNYTKQLDNPPLGISESLLQSTLPILNDYSVIKPNTINYCFFKPINDDYTSSTNPTLTDIAIYQMNYFLPELSSLFTAQKSIVADSVLAKLQSFQSSYPHLYNYSKAFLDDILDYSNMNFFDIASNEINYYYPELITSFTNINTTISDTIADKLQPFSSSFPQLYNYSTAAFKGAYLGIKNTINAFSHPYKEIFYPEILFVYDTQILVDKFISSTKFLEYKYQLLSDKTNFNPWQELLNYFESDDISYNSVNRMLGRFNNLGSFVDQFKTGSGPDRVEVGTAFLVSELFPGGVADIFHMGNALSNYRKFKTYSTPPLFHHNREYDIVTSPPPIKEYTIDEIRSQKGEQSYIYVINENNELKITTYKYPAPIYYNNNIYFFVGHPELSGLKPVYASGQFFTKDGVGTEIDNVSGHYYPTGKHLKNLVETNFSREGFEEAKDLFKYSFVNPKKPYIVKTAAEGRQYLINQYDDLMGRAHNTPIIIKEKHHEWWDYVASSMMDISYSIFTKGKPSSQTPNPYDENSLLNKDHLDSKAKEKIYTNSQQNTFFKPTKQHTNDDNVEFKKEQSHKNTK